MRTVFSRNSRKWTANSLFSAPQNLMLVCRCMLLLFLLGCGIFTASGYAQTSYGSVVGTVTDPSGAAVVGAKVSVQSNATNATQDTQTGSGGTYSFVNLTPGSYSVTVVQSGFKTNTSNQIDVHIGGATRADVRLDVGNVAETVTVTAAQAALQTDSTSLSGVIEGRQVLEAPLNGRNVNNLLDFVPGVVPGGGTQGSTMANGGSGNFQAGGQTQAIAYGNYQIGGAFSGQSLFFIDGVGSNIAENNVNSLVPTQDAVQEFRVSTNNVSAEFGGYGGGIIEIATKSGTNAFHGSAYEYFRNTVLDANDWFSNDQKLGKSPLHQNQYGANIGGPALKNKLFFYFSWEHESLASASPTQAVVPTTAELTGDFSVGNDATHIIYDPLTLPPNAGPPKPFPGNKIPANRIDPAALKILQLETPNQSRVIQTPLTNNFFANAPIHGFQDQYNARIDATLAKDNVFARYTFWNPHNDISDPMGTKTGSGPTGNYTQEAVVGDNHTFNQTTVAELRLSYIQNYNFQYVLSRGFDMSSINANYGAVQAQSVGQVGMLPGLGITNYGIGAGLSQLFWNNNVWAATGSVTKILGKHTIKAGGTWRQVLWTGYGNTQGLTLGAAPGFTGIGGTTGNALASFMLGIPSTSNISLVGTTHSFFHPYGLFVADTYQMTSKLTLTLGLRWEQPGAFSERDKKDTVLQPNAPTSVGSLTSINNPVTGAAVPLTGRLAYVESPEYPSGRDEKLHWLTFSPRVGFAYRLTPKTVVRSGYGISYFPVVVSANGATCPCNGNATPNTNTVGSPITATVANPMPNGVNQVFTGRPASALLLNLGSNIAARIPDQHLGYSQQWNLAVERALDNNSTVVVAYAGSKGTHLTLGSGFTGTSFNLNQIPDNYLASEGNNLLKQVPNPFYGYPMPATSTTYTKPTIAEGYLLTPRPEYRNVNQQVPRYGWSNYHALQATYIRRFAHGGVIQGAYTWGKLISNTENTSSFQDGQGGLGVVQNFHNLKAEKAISQQSLAHNLVVNYGLDLPFGQGQMYLSHVKGAANAVVGGWRIGGITTMRSGLPLGLLAQGGANAGPSQFGSGAIRPDYVAGCAKDGVGDKHTHARSVAWFNKACFVQPAFWSFGNESRIDSHLRADGLVDFDVTVTKSFNLTERSQLKFSTETFNIFNHPQFAQPGTTVGSPTYGVVGHQQNLPRTIQFALRLTY